MNDKFFCAAFEKLTGLRPLSWQCRLYQRWTSDQMTPVIDLPTGLGKTMVMAIWLIARTNHPGTIPTRLIYVVDRRTVVDQATVLALKLRANFKGRLAVSTLRGQLADNHEWTADPSTPAVIVGTVDLVGSALLFSGYRSSFRRRPLEAGLLGQDSLLILDEAHLSTPFERLLTGITSFQRSDAKPMRVVRMSATCARLSDTASFVLDDSDLKNRIIHERYNARKRLTVAEPVEDVNRALADSAIELAASQQSHGSRIAIFSRQPADVRKIANAIRNHGSRKGAPGPYADVVEVLTGTMRGLERDRLLEKPVLKRFLDGDENPTLDEPKTPVFLVSTSAGEVGMDLNADHIAGDATTLDSWIQRLGRVNRRGKGKATVILVKEKTPAAKTPFEKACIASSALLADGLDVSPAGLAALKKGLTTKDIDNASSPVPRTVHVTDILLDAWSMTSIDEPMPGRPAIGPWLRGIDEQASQMAVAWRAELDLFQDLGRSPDYVRPEKALRAIFTKHPIRPHEALTVNTGQLLEFLKSISRIKEQSSKVTSALVAIRFPAGKVVCRTLQALSDNPEILYADSTLILPATLGGIDGSGMLDPESLTKEGTGADGVRSLDVADYAGYEYDNALRPRLRVVIERGDGLWSAKPLPGLTIPDNIVLQASYDRSSDLFKDLKAAGLRIRLVQPISVDDEGDVAQSLVALAPAPIDRNKKEDQQLTKHVEAVEDAAGQIADALGLRKDDPIRVALLFAAKWHDEGKKASIWQCFAMNPAPEGEPLGKMAQSRDPRTLRGYRHEFGTLLRIQHTERCATTGCNVPIDIDTRDLALHMIATHHGWGRPQFGDAVYDPFTDAERDALAVDAIRRFGRLQRKHGWWRLAWLENLLRCADQRVSADEATTEVDELDEDKQ